MSKYAHIDIQVMKSLVDSKVPVTILDARTKEWDDGRRIPGAKSLPVNSDVTLYEKAISDKNALVAVYCGGLQCPAGKNLAEKLVQAGYKNVLEYAGGIKEWSDEQNLPIER